MQSVIRICTFKGSARASTLFHYLNKKLEENMIARLTFISLQQGHEDEVKKIYNEEIVPVVRKQRGNIGIWLLEPQNENDQFISLTEWATQEDADAYQTSGTYKQLVDKVKDMFAEKADLKTYSVAETAVLQHS